MARTWIGLLWWIRFWRAPGLAEFDSSLSARCFVRGNRIAYRGSGGRSRVRQPSGRAVVSVSVWDVAQK